MTSQILLTPAARRIVSQCRQLSRSAVSDNDWAGHLVLMLLLDESLASASLRKQGITIDWLKSGALGAVVADTAAVLSESSRTGETDGGTPDDAGCVALSALDVSSAGSRQPGDRGVSGVAPGIDDPRSFSEILDRAAAISRRVASENGVSSSHLLLAVVERNSLIRDRFAACGMTEPAIRREHGLELPGELPSLEVDCQLNFASDEPATGAGQTNTTQAEERLAEDSRRPPDDQRMWRVLDACLNRAREGLRVLEDYVRFVLSDQQLTSRLKSLRHEVAASEALLKTQRQRPSGAATSSEHTPLMHRDTGHDVGTTLTVGSEMTRDSLSQIVLVNFRRVQESLRSLEEFGKLVSSPFSALMKTLRYQSYELEQQVHGVTGVCVSGARAEHSVTENGSGVTDGEERELTEWRRRRLQQAHLYALLTEEFLRVPWQDWVRQLLDGGVDIIQLREKHLADGELLRRARWLSAACREAGALMIMNDRPDLAVVSRADGVHIGQDEIPAAEARHLIGSSRLLGISTHDLQQVAQAIAAGADYLGTGPVFPGRTKSFSEFPGLGFVREVATVRPTVPWFPIGGIELNNVGQLTDFGVVRAAVTGALSATDDPLNAARQLKSLLLNASLPQSSGGDASRSSESGQADLANGCGAPSCG